jgi:hypothetical protein
MEWTAVALLHLLPEINKKGIYINFFLIFSNFIKKFKLIVHCGLFLLFISLSHQLGSTEKKSKFLIVEKSAHSKKGGDLEAEIERR